MNGRAAGQALATGVADTWAQHDKQRLAWAFRAYGRFADSLSPEIRERLAQKDHQAEAYVVVFGKTQVGKTTLLMDLMGVFPTHMARVAQVLRGGRPAGQSATATTMEYRRSPDQRWGLNVDEAGTEWCGDDANMEAALGRLRTAMETRQLVVHAPCVVFVPIDCFNLQAARPAVRMLDLPGDKPANAAEQEHVHAMARKYVPLADLILLVGRGDDLSFLQGGGLTLPGIEDWQSAPQRFRIVTTYSFTAQSVRALVRQHEGPAEAPLYRQRLIEQIERSVPLSADVKRLGHFFPLEFGQSWLDARQAQPLLFERVEPMMAALKRQLLDDIQASTTPVARLRAAVEAHIIIARVKEKRLQSMRETGVALEAELAREQGYQTQAQHAVDQVKEECARLAQSLAELTDQQLSQDLAVFVFPVTEPGDPDKSVDGFKSIIRRTKTSLKNAVAASHPDMSRLSGTQRFWRQVRIAGGASGIDTILDNSFRSFIVHLDEYWADSYWSEGEDSSYAKDRRTLRRCIESAQLELTQLAKEMWHTTARGLRSDLAKALEQQRYAQLEFQQIADDRINPIKVVVQKLAEHTLTRELFEQQMEADLLESRRFRELLDIEYMAELAQRRQTLITSDQPVKGFLGLMAAVQLVDIRQQVLLHVEPAAT